MRVLHIDTGSEMRGGQWQAFHLMEALTKAGHHAVMLAPGGSPLYERLKSMGLAR